MRFTECPRSGRLHCANHNSPFHFIVKQGHKLITLLLLVVCALPAIAAPPAPKVFRDNWEDADRYWSVWYDVNEGSIHARVLAYDREYGPLDEDGFIDYAHLQYSTDGANFTDYYYIDYNSGPSEKEIGPRNGVSTSYTKSDDGRNIYLNIRLDLDNSIKNISQIRITGNWGVNGGYGSDGIKGTKSVSITQMSGINTPTYDFVTVQSNNVFSGKARINYSKISLNTVDNLSTIKLYNSNGTALSGDMTISTSGSFDVPLTNTATSYYYKQSAYGGRITTNSGTITVPAFTLPKAATAVYDTTTHIVTFSWTIDPATGNNIINDKFKLQVADNANFTDAKDVSVDYDATKSSFSYSVDKNLSPHMYFRVARDRVGFNWDLAKKADVIIAFNPINQNSVSLTLQPDNTALLKWTPRPSAWIPGASFVITRINNTGKTQTEIRLTEDDFKKGSYIDQQISICNEYTYTLQVVPPVNSPFTAFAATQLPNKILPTEIGTIFNLIASKGYFADRTELTWSAKGAFDNFIIKRAVYGTNNFVQVSSITGASNSDFQTDDTKGTPGIYYTYMVVGVVKCNNVPVYSKDTLYAIGFRSPTGNIYGRVTYENGQAVENVAVRLQSNDATQLGQSILLNGNSNSYLKLDSLNTNFTDTAFTIESWIKPTDASPVNQVIFSRNGQYELGFNGSGQLYFGYKGSNVTGTYTNANQSFVHIAGIHTRDSLLLMLDDVVIGRVANAFTASTNADKVVYIGRKTSGNNFKGYVDEMRAWNVAVDPAMIARDYTRILAGNDNGLAAYWRFDETIVDQFYDLSHKSDQYNQNNGVMNAQYVQRTKTVPTADQLSLKAYTDVSGNYMISGIPFAGSGTTYSIVPLLGTHQFDPISVNRLVSSTSSEFTVDFKDKSSFPVSGFVYYNGGTVPVPNVQFKIDGKLAQQTNGTIIETDDAGKFTILVPVGTHEVQAVKNNHVFVNNGKITDISGNNLNYQGPISSRILLDSTTVRFIGRVAGGAIQDAYPLGHSLSVNNIGKEMSVTMVLPSGTKYDLYTPTVNNREKTVVLNHLLPSNIKDSSKIHKSRVVYQQNKIIIYPDSITGEFAADLIPEKFIADNVNVTGWGDILDGKPVTIDLGNKFTSQHSVRGYQDSVKNGQGNWIVSNYLDTVKYNASYKFIKRITPSVSIVQLDNSGKEVPYFGNKVFETLTFAGRKENVTVVDSSKTGKAMYIFGNPVFNQNQLYHFVVKAYELYPFYDNVVNGVPVVKQKSGKDVIDNVPTQDGFVSLFNNIRNGFTGADTLSLDYNGHGYYDFIAGDPDLAAQGLKDFAATVRFGPATNISWQWNGDPQMKVFVMGGKLTGTDFITAGPDKVMMVLRDPPGSKSFSYAEKGSVISSSSTYSGTFKQEGDLDFTQKLGAELITFTGVGVGTINTAVASTGIGFGIHHEEHYTGTNTTENTTTLTTRFQTSDDPLFVGPPADVFVGYSTNITYGQSNNITIVRRSELKPADITIYEPDPASEYLVVQRSGINIGEVFGTMFAYPQQHIEKILIPNLINIRNLSLLPPTTVDADAQQLANNTKKAVYVSKLLGTDANFGKSNNDTLAFGASAKTDPYDNGKSYKIFFPVGSLYRTDTILTLNQYINSWQQRMADNEKAKLNATLVQNYSFHAGTTVEHSKETSVKTTKDNEFSFIISGSVTNSTDVKIKGNGFEFKFKEAVGTEQGGTFSSGNDSTMNFGFSLGSNGTDDYFSVDVSRASDSAFVFRTKGGVSGCPYQGLNVTKYYQPGTVLDQPTQRIEVPKLSVDKPVVSNIPSVRKASYNLYLRNESEAKLPATFVLGYVDNDSIKGATISIDGSPIGGNGRAVVVQYGETVTKVLTLEKGPNAMDYNNIMILLHSGCQYDPTGYQENIADTVLISAHFIPSCSDIHIKSPKDKWVLNAESPVNSQNKRYLPVTIDQFDITNSLFDHIELQYKPSSTSTWITSMKFYADSTKYLAAQGDKQFISNAQALNYNLVLDDATFNDQHYDIQAVSYCDLGASNYVTTESNVAAGIKDTYFPRLFGSPQPANGVLGISDEIRLNFNETIAGGLLTYPNFQVTGIRNGVQGDHSVSVRLDGVNNYVSTEFEKNLVGKNVTAEMWVLPVKQADETIFSHGSINESMEMALTADNHLQLMVGKKTLKSSKAFTYKQGEWAHVAMVYNPSSKTVSAFYNYEELIHNAPVDPYTGIGRFEFGRSINKQGNYFNGKMHEVRVWSDTLNGTQLQVNSLKQLSGAENKLLAYYPMNEGKGTVCFDKAHGSNAKLVGLWSTPPGKAIKLNGNSYVKMNTAHAPITSAMDYTVEMWFKGDASQADATLASNGRGNGTDANKSLNYFSLGFEKGLLTYANNGFKVQADGNYLDNSWHHVALSVNRNSANAQLFVDGNLQKYFDAKNLGGIASAYTYLGATAWQDTISTNVTYEKYFTGYIDEFRVWNTYLNQALISNNNNVRLSGNELGLKVYYPFEKYVSFQNNQQMIYSLSDMTIQEDANLNVPDATVLNATQSDETAPVKDRGPVDNLKFDFVVNNDALIINMQEPRQAIDKTIVTFKVKNVRDMNGNLIASPITWTAYIDQNQLKWSDAELNLAKDVYAPMQFESYLVNSGGNLQHYRLDNLPRWLTATPSNGTVDPKGKQKIVFTVNDGLNIGSYDEIVYMRNDNNESEALKINLKVKGKQPEWTVYPPQFKYNMSVYGKIRINNVFSINKEDMLAAFINGKCVGVTHNIYNAQADLWYAFLTIYSDSLQFDKLEFRLWQANTGKVYQAIPTSAVTFNNNAIVGSPSTPVIFDGKDMLYQDITLNENWNWISFNLANANFNNIGTTLANGKWGAGDIVKNELLGFSQYSAANGWVGYLSGFNNTSLFMLKSTYAQSVSVNGTAVDVKTTAIPLKGARWNYISYLPQVNMTVKEALSGYAATDEDVVKSQTGFAMYSSQNGWVGSLTYMEPGKGYMFYRKSSVDTNFYYPSLAGSLTNQLGGRLANVNPNTLQSPVAANFSYANNMTVVAVIEKGFEVRPGDHVLAFVGGELRGKSMAINNPVIQGSSYFFNITGEQEQPVYFMIERDGALIAQSEPISNYFANASIGTVTSPVVLHFKKESAGFTVYPNPFTNKLNIVFDAKLGQTLTAGVAQLFIYDAAGRLVNKGEKGSVSNGYYKTSWNGRDMLGGQSAPGVYFINLVVDGKPNLYKVIKH